MVAPAKPCGLSFADVALAAHSLYAWTARAAHIWKRCITAAANVPDKGEAQSDSSFFFCIGRSKQNSTAEEPGQRDCHSLSEIAALLVI